VTADELAKARAALARADWQAAHDAARAATSTDPVASAERLDLLADALWWLGGLDDCIEHRESAYRAFDELGEQRRAGQCAVWLYEHYCFKARPAIAGAWLQRARRALDADPECVEHGALVLREVEAAHGRGELETAAGLARGIIELGRRLRSTDLEAEALQTLGRVLIDQGNVSEGLAHLDESMLFAIEGRLGPYATGKVYCSLISACEELGDFARAAEWTEATSRWASDHPFAIFPGICRVHRASALTWRGELSQAEIEAAKACAELISIHLPNAGAAFAEVGDIRRRLGDLDGAEVAFAKAEELCGRSCAGVALLRLAQGRVDAAIGIIGQCLDAAAWNGLARAKLLPAQVQISVAAGDLETADASATELEETAADFDTGILRPAALVARGRVQLAKGDNGGACVTLRNALDRWQALDVPYEIASTRTLLGQALRDADPDAAAVSFAAAEALFEQIGARLDARQTRDSRTIAGPVSLPAGLTEREVEVLQLIAAGYTNREIAAALFLSAKTVSRHLSNIFAKICVSSRSAATAFAFEHNLVAGRREA
jgi:DNA-binding CsgD family transcriptional regulator